MTPVKEEPGREAVLSDHLNGTLGETTLESYGLPRRLPAAERSVAIGEVARLEDRLLDGAGHLRQELSDEQAGALLEEINALRCRLGWLKRPPPAHRAGSRRTGRLTMSYQ